MAFMGMFIIGIVLFIIAVFLIAMVICFIAAIVLRIKGHKTASIISLSVGGVILTGFIILGVIILGPKTVNIETPSGEIYSLKDTETNAFEDAINSKDLNTVNKMLDEYPYLIYYRGISNQALIDVASKTLDIDLTQTLISHGARFDGEFEHNKSIFDYSLDCFFSDITGMESNRDVNRMAEFMIDNGAEISFENKNQPNALFKAIWYICDDGSVQEIDIELLEMLIDHGADVTDKDSSSYSLAETFDMAAFQNGIYENDIGYQKAMKLLTSQ